MEQIINYRKIVKNNSNYDSSALNIFYNLLTLDNLYYSDNVLKINQSKNFFFH